MRKLPAATSPSRGDAGIKAEHVRLQAFLDRASRQLHSFFYGAVQYRLRPAEVAPTGAMPKAIRQPCTAKATKEAVQQQCRAKRLAQAVIAEFQSTMFMSMSCRLEAALRQHMHPS